MGVSIPLRSLGVLQGGRNQGGDNCSILLAIILIMGSRSIRVR
jgi:hypothetical protein